MYTNGYTKAPYQSLVVVTGFNWSPNPFNTHVMTTTAFADQSEHITLVTRNADTYFSCVKDGHRVTFADAFTGI